MLAIGFGFSLVGLLIWVGARSLESQIIGLILLLWGVGAGLRALVGIVKAVRDRK
jgi:hypothetical protein